MHMRSVTFYLLCSATMSDCEQSNSDRDDGKKRKAVGHSVHDPISVRPVDRVKQYPNNHFIVSAEKFFCTACREEVSTKKSVINLHIKSAKGKESALKCYDRSRHAVEDSLPDLTRVFCIKVVILKCLE